MLQVKEAAIQTIRNSKICAMLTELIERLSHYNQTRNDEIYSNAYNSDVSIIIANAIVFKEAIESGELEIPLGAAMGFSKFESDAIDDESITNLLYDIDYFARFNQPRR